MKLKQLITTACIAGLLSSVSWAQGANGLIDVSKLKDKKVANLQGQDLGKITQVLVEPQSGRVRYAVVGVDQQETAVPWNALQVKKQGQQDFNIQLDATKEKLTSAPKFQVGDADRLFTREASQPVYSYWAIMWVDDPSGSGASSTAGRSGGTSGASGTPGSGTGTSGASGTSGTTSTGSTSTSPQGGSTSSGAASGTGTSGATNPGSGAAGNQPRNP